MPAYICISTYLSIYLPMEAQSSTSGGAFNELQPGSYYRISYFKPMDFKGSFEGDSTPYEAHIGLFGSMWALRSYKPVES